jgi:hypothetical protein
MAQVVVQTQRLNVWRKINVLNDFEKNKDASVFDENKFVYYKQ